jgi:hypothetical protein
MDRPTDPADRRIASRAEPGVWIGAVRRVFGPISQVVSTDQGDTIENHPPHYLVALWAPLRDDEAFLRRWPDSVSIALNDHDCAVQELLRSLPIGARLWITTQELDWAVIAEIAMLSEAQNFQAEHYRELQRFIDQQRVESLATISANYTDRESGFQGFLGTLQSPTF